METKKIHEATDKEIYGMEFLGHYARETVLKLRDEVTEEATRPATEHLFKRVQELGGFIQTVADGVWSDLSPDNGAEYTYGSEWVLDSCENIVGRVPDPHYSGEGMRILRGTSTYISVGDPENREWEEEMYWHDHTETRHRGDYSRWRPVSERSDD